MIDLIARHVPREQNLEADTLVNEMYEAIPPMDFSQLEQDHWRNDPPSKKQIAFLNQKGFEVPSTKGEAFDLVASLRK